MFPGEGVVGGHEGDGHAGREDGEQPVDVPPTVHLGALPSIVCHGMSLSLSLSLFSLNSQ